MKLLRLVVKSPLKHLLGKLGIIIPLKYGWKSKLTPNISLRLVVYMHILSPLIIPIIHDYTSWYPHHIPTVSLYPYSLNGYTVTHVHVFFICFNHQTDLKSEPNHQWRVVQFPDGNLSSIPVTGAVTSLAQAHSRRGGRTPAGVAHDLIRDHLRFRGVWTQKGTSPNKSIHCIGNHWENSIEKSLKSWNWEFIGRYWK